MASYTTSDFLTSVRNRGNIPTTTNTNNVNNTANLLRIATEELQSKLLPIIMSAREEFYVTHEDQAITANQRAYPIPSRALGMALRDVQVITGTSINSLPPIDSEQISTTGTGTPEGYYFEHGNLILYPTPSSTASTLRMRYFARPNTLAAITDCASIATIDTNTNSVTVSTIPASWTTGTVIDFIRALNPHNCVLTDQTIVSVVSTTITFSSLPTGLVVGDWIARAEYTPIPQVPREFQPVLAQMTVIKILEAQGDKDGVMIATKDLDKLIESGLSMIQPRNQGERKKIIPRRWR
jgi:hypothetical protein